MTAYIIEKSKDEKVKLYHHRYKDGKGAYEVVIYFESSRSKTWYGYSDEQQRTKREAAARKDFDRLSKCGSL